ncbi:MAG: stage III sporulation protein AD [Clostridiales bacterium]|nr:stage III sporulation protein AD [Clostridiales bacterium]
MEIVRVSLLGVGGVMLGFILKETKPEYACLVTAGIGLVIMGLSVGKLSYIFQVLTSVEISVDGDYILTLAKMVGITYIGQFSAGICQDAGYSSTGDQIRLFGRLSVMTLCMPILLALLETIREFLS